MRLKSAFNYFMPSRYDVFYNGGIYHIYDKTLDGKLIFSPEISEEFINIFCYYRSELSTKLRYSLFKKLPEDIYQERWKEIFYPKHFLVDILTFTLLPTHYHFQIKQLKDNGIITFMSNILNSITRFFNNKNERKGPIFLPQFRSKRLKSQESLIFVSKYIHVNCYAHGIVKELENIFTYPYSSIKSYISSVNDMKINFEKVMHSFGNNPEKYQKFILNNAEDQRMKELIKYADNWTR